MIFGRELELGILSSQYEQMLAGHGSVLFLTGEAGLGKTTLVHAWWAGHGSKVAGSKVRGSKVAGSKVQGEEASSLNRATLDLGPFDPATLDPGPLFLESACSIPIGNADVGRLEALQPWVDAMDQLVRVLPEHGVRGKHEWKKKKFDVGKFLIDTAPSWITMVPVLGPSVGAAMEILGAGYDQVYMHQKLQAQHGVQSASNQQQVFQQYVNMLTKVSADTPIVIFLDDLHWADTSSCNLLFYLSRQIADKKILVICTYRPEDAAQSNEGKGHAILSIKNEMLRYETGTEVALGYLGADAVRSIMRGSYGGYETDGAFESWLLKLSDGNALFVTQFLKTLGEDQLLDANGRFVGTYDHVQIPATALAVVEERTRRLDEGTRELLMYATAEGEEFTTYVLERLSEKKPMELLKDLQRATTQGLISQRGKSRLFANQTTNIFGFSHALFHKALYGQLIDAQKDYLHRQCYELLKTEWDRLGDSKHHTTTLATKLLTHAEKSEEWGTVADVALEAGQEFWKTYNEEESLEMVARVHAAAEKDQSLVVHVAEALFLEGSIGLLRGRYAEAIASYQTAETGFRAAGNIEREIDAVARMVWCQRLTGDYATCTAVAIVALDRAVAQGYLKGQAALLNNIGNVYQSQGFHAEALEYYAKSFAIQESIEDCSGMAVSLNNIGTVHFHLGRYVDALEHHAKSLAIKESIHDRQGVSYTLTNIGNVHYSQGRFVEAMDCFENSVAIQESIQDVAGVAQSLNGIGTVYELQGRYAEALEYFAKSLAILESIHDPRGVAILLNNMGEVHRYLGSHLASAECLTRSLILSRKIDNRSLSASTLCELGRLSEAEAETLAGDARTAKLREAIERINEGIAIYGELHRPQDVATRTKDLVRIQELLERG
jgi:predicted ATPase